MNQILQKKNSILIYSIYNYLEIRMKAFTICLTFIIVISVIHAQETASAEASTPNNSSNTISNPN